MMQIPDAPWIREAETNGVPDDDPVFCPVCDEECETIYKDNFGEVFGCEHCISTQESYEWAFEQREAEKEDFEEHSKWRNDK